MWICSCLRTRWPSPHWSSSHCVVLLPTQVEAGWLHGELLGDSAHSEHLPQPRQSPSLLGLLREAHRSVEQELCVRHKNRTFSSHMFLIHHARLWEKCVHFESIVRVMHDRSWVCTTFQEVCAKTIHSAGNQLFMMLVVVATLATTPQTGVYLILLFNFEPTEFYNLINCPKLNDKFNKYKIKNIYVRIRTFWTAALLWAHSYCIAIASCYSYCCYNLTQFRLFLTFSLAWHFFPVTLFLHKYRYSSELRVPLSFLPSNSTRKHLNFN